MPAGLSPLAKAEWQRMAWRLKESKTVTVVDDAALYQYARLYAETEQASQMAETNRAAIATLEDQIGELQGDALIQAIDNITRLRQLDLKYAVHVRQGRMAIRQYLVEFGMTPAARGRVKIAEGEKATDPFDDFDGGTVN